MNALVGVWLWACETRLILAPPAIAAAWLAARCMYRAAYRWAARQSAPAWDWRDDEDPAAADEAALDEAELDEAELAELIARYGPPHIDTQPAPEDDTSRQLDAQFYADAYRTRKETGQ